MKKKLLMMATGGMLGVSLIAAGGTYALFSASTSNSNNTFTAGTVNLNSLRDQGDTVETPGPMFYGAVDDPTGLHPYDATTASTPNNELPGDWAPGDQVSRMLNVQNTGSLDLKITKIMADLQSITINGMAVDPSSQTYADFMQHMKITVYSPDDTYTAPVFSGTLQQLLSGYQTLARNMVLMKGTTNWDVKFIAAMDSTAGNDLQGVKGVFGFSLYAEQLRNNP